jgi:pimeloyl-ACP methyl ester carboxylesterase
LLRTGGEKIDWVGTSMGGIIGMLLAAEAHTPIRRLVINDIGRSSRLTRSSVSALMWVRILLSTQSMRSKNICARSMPRSATQTLTPTIPEQAAPPKHSPRTVTNHGLPL